MKKNKIIKYLFLGILFIFIISYVVEESGYYEYKLKEKTTLTEESIKQFEEDVKTGKDIDINDYIVEDYKDYSNNLTKTTMKISNTINKYVRKSVVSVFRILNRIIEE